MDYRHKRNLQNTHYLRNVRSGRKILATVFVTMVAATVTASDKLPFKLGLWETVTTTKSDFTGASGKTHTSTECVTEDLFENMAAQMEEGMPGAQCEVTQKIDGNVVAITMSCSAPEGKMQAEGRYVISDDGNSMQGSMNMQMDFGGFAGNMAVEATGKYLGAC